MAGQLTRGAVIHQQASARIHAAHKSYAIITLALWPNHIDNSGAGCALALDHEEMEHEVRCMVDAAAGF